MNHHPTLPDAALTDMENEAVRAWRDLFSVTAHPIREAIANVVREGADTLTEDFYSRMQTHPRAASFLDQERVQRRLRASLRQWMIDLFGTLEIEQISPAIRRQIEVGAVHARIRLPIDLIPSGIRLLKRGNRLISHKRSASFERARQRAALSEWAEALLISVWTQPQPGTGARLRDSELGQC